MYRKNAAVNTIDLLSLDHREGQAKVFHLPYNDSYIAQKNEKVKNRLPFPPI